MEAIRRRIWWVPAGLSALFVLFGIGDVLGGIAFNEGQAPAFTGLTLEQLRAEQPEGFRLVDVSARGGGVILASLGLVLTAVAVFAYRQGDAWAWWTMWVLPIFPIVLAGVQLAYGLAPDQAPPASLGSAPVISGIAAIALLLDVPRFRTSPAR